MAVANTPRYGSLPSSIDTVTQPRIKVITYVITGNSTLHYEWITQTRGYHTVSFPSTTVEDNICASILRRLSTDIVYCYHVLLCFGLT
jgi:hypothetical protein